MHQVHCGGGWGFGTVPLRIFCHMQAFTEKSMEFQTKIIERSGLGDETYLPDGRPAALPCTPKAEL